MNAQQALGWALMHFLWQGAAVALLTWVALRRCLECGHIGCCDSSPAKHATGHFHSTQHPVIQSAQPGENWRWCYVHHTTG